MRLLAAPDESRDGRYTDYGATGRVRGCGGLLLENHLTGCSLGDEEGAGEVDGDGLVEESWVDAISLSISSSIAQI